MIGALGVLDDVTVTQTSAVWELRAANPALTRGQLYAAALRIGRDHVASAVNTLVMAYAGAALPLLLYSSISGVGIVNILGVAVDRAGDRADAGRQHRHRGRRAGDHGAGRGRRRRMNR